MNAKINNAMTVIRQKAPKAAKNLLIATTIATAGCLGTANYRNINAENTETQGGLALAEHKADLVMREIKQGEQLTNGNPIQKAYAHFDDWVDKTAENTRPVEAALALQMLGLCAASGASKKENN